MEIKACWKLNHQLNSFSIPLRIINAKTRISIIKWCIFDTGFTGYVSLDDTTIQNLKLPTIGHGQGYTISGKIAYENYSGLVEIIDDQQETIAVVKIMDTIKSPETDIIVDDEGVESNSETTSMYARTIPIQVFKLPLIGMKAIEQFSWLILGDQEMLCLVNL